MYAQIMIKQNHMVNLVGGLEVGLPIEHADVICVKLQDGQDIKVGMHYNPDNGSFFENELVTRTSTADEKQAAYDILSIQYIHEKYSLDDENKIMREYLADMDNADCKTAFNVYNAYVEECKQRAHKEIHGE